MMDKATFEENEVSELPESWIWVPLANLSEILRGVTYKKTDATNISSSSNMAILRATNIREEKLILDQDLVYIPIEKVLSDQLLKNGDIVICTSSGSKSLVGKAAQLQEEWYGSFGAFCAVVRPVSNISQKYLGYFFSSEKYRHFISQKSSGVNINNLKKSDFDEVIIPLAPLNEQKRIVDEIEAQFTRLDAGIVALKRLESNLKRYKASVLKAACEGDLVPQDPDDESASELLARILQERREKWESEQLAKYETQGKKPPKGWQDKYQAPVEPDTDGLPELPDGWIYIHIDALLSFLRPGMKTGPFGSLLKKHEHQPSGIPVFGIENIDEMSFKQGNKIFVTEEKAQDLQAYEALAGDILISRSGTVGEVCVVPDGLGDARISTNLMRVVLHTQGMSPQFFALLFNGSPYVLQQVSDLCSGSTRDFLNQQILKALVFPLPPSEEQTRIIQAVEKEYSVIEKIEFVIHLNIKRAERLRQSILKEAFAGRLVPQDPSDEPASELLKRIQAEREKQT